MIKEAYVSYEVAELLREKGFDGEFNTQMFYSKSGKTIFAPTHQMALAWLREKGVIISIRATNFPYEEGNLHYVADILGADEKWKDNDICFDTYEEATEAALEYSLKNLL